MNTQKIHDKHQLAQLIRFKAHMLDITIKTVNVDVEAKKTVLAELNNYLQEWKQKGYDEGADYNWAKERIDNFKSWLAVKNQTIHKKPLVPDDNDSNLAEIIKNRRSIRFWKKKQVSREILHQIIEAATYAPTAFNRMEWKFYVAETPLDNMIEGDASNSSMFEKAPVRIFVAVDETLFFEKYSGALDTGFALQNMILMAHSLGLGSCLIYQGEFVDPEFLEKHYSIPVHMKVYCAVTLGYPDETPDVPARMKVEEVTKFLGIVPNPEM
jgi:nitroreductase